VAGRLLGRPVLLVTGLLACGLVIGIGSRTWASAAVPGLPGAELITVSGRQAAPVLTALALACAAGMVVLGTAGRLVRAPVAVGVALSGLGVVLVSVRTGRQPDGALAAALADRYGLVGPGLAGQLDPASVVATGWPWSSAAAGLLLALAGVLASIGSRHWPVPGRRFSAPATAGPAADRSPAGGEPDRIGSATTGQSPAVLDPTLSWDAISRGEDPTAAGESAGSA
jgi:uncharacterized membrane protein (TIGR02234 family)